VLPYYDYGQTVSGGVATAGTRFFSCNGIYDPDITGTGHQPMGFDQMMLLYEQYTVMGAKISAHFIGGDGPACVGIYINPDTTAITNPIQLVENGLVAVQHIDCGSGGGGTGQRDKTVTKFVDIARYFSRPRGLSIVNDPELHGTAATNPAEQAYFGICAWEYSDASAVTTYYDVLIEYDVVFSEPRKLASS
jgi:hypothetical protein